MPLGAFCPCQPFAHVCASLNDEGPGPAPREVWASVELIAVVQSPLKFLSSVGAALHSPLAATEAAVELNRASALPAQRASILMEAVKLSKLPCNCKVCTCYPV